MAKASKRIRQLREQGVAEELSVDKAFEALKKGATAKFDEAIEVAIRLGIDPRKSDQAVRGVAAMPAGTGKSVRVAAVCQGDNIQLALDAGADIADADALIDSIGKGELGFDVLIAEPTLMARLGKHGKMLGPKGLMPNPKSGTVTNDIAAAVARAKAGQVTYRAERGGIIHAAIGKASFSDDDLLSNFNSLVDSVKKAKPAAAKGQYLVNIRLSTTMGPAVAIDVGPLR